MPTCAATATLPATIAPLTTSPPGGAVAVLILTAIAVTLSYLLACWIWPYTACRRCHGTGKLRSPTGRAIRLCRRCQASGLHRRPGFLLITLTRHIRNRRNR